MFVSGNGNIISFKGAIDKIIISGKNNDIYTESVEQVIVSGNSNIVSWEKSKNVSGKPVVQDKGAYNNIGMR